MSRGRPEVIRAMLLWVALPVAAIAALIAYLAYGAGEDQERSRDSRELRESAREARRDQRRTRLTEQSAELMPPELAGVALGQPLDEVREARPRMRQTANQPQEDPDLEAWEETLPSSARAIYLFERDARTLRRVQVMSLLPTVEAIVPHLTAMIENYGSPTAVFDCPHTGDVPTRRFMWRHSQVTVSDIFLVYGSRVSLTLYLAPNADTDLSLRRSGCRPVDRESLDTFPVADVEQLRRDQEEARRPRTPTSP